MRTSAPRARFTGYQLDSGYAEQTVADERFCYPLPAGYADLEVAPLLCAGLIGYRSLRLAGRAAGSGSTASARPRTSLYRSRATADSGCSRSCGQGTTRPRASRSA